MIVAGSTSQALATDLATRLDRSLAAVERERFPDGEFCASVPGFDADGAVVVAATTDCEAHLELLQLQDAVREAGAETVTTVVPYLGYARQDAAFEPGGPVSARAVARAVSTGTDRVVLVTPHEATVADFFTVPTTVVDAAPALAGPLDDLVDPVFVAPDAGAIDLAERVRDAHGRGTADHFEKTRHGSDDVTIEPSAVDVTGRDLVLVDDIVSTGATTSAAAAAVAADARTTTVACVHAVFANGARTRLARAGVDRIVATDTVERSVSVAGAAPIVAGAV